MSIHTHTNTNRYLLPSLHFIIQQTCGTHIKRYDTKYDINQGRCPFHIVFFVALTILTSSFTTDLHSAGAVYIDLVHVIFLMTLSHTQLLP